MITCMKNFAQTSVILRKMKNVEKYYPLIAHHMVYFI